MTLLSQKVLDEKRLLSLPISSLAYVGDAVYELAVRGFLLESSQAASGSLFQASLAYVKAEAQAARLECIRPLLNAQEEDLVRRARNHASSSKPKHADPVAYRYATALEALCGWLWLSGQEARLEQLLAKAIESEDSHGEGA